MKRQLYQSQYILNQVFDNEERILRATLNNSQDYLNAVYDSSKDALRINLAGGMLPMVDTPSDLPDSAEEGQICPVYNSTTGGIDFYEFSGTEWLLRGSTVVGGNNEAIQWVSQNLEKLKEVAEFNYIVNVDEITLPSGGGTTVMVQGSPQNIDDDLDGDNDDTTPYRIDVSGYVMSVSTYETENSPVPDRYYTRITYDSSMGSLGTSHIYLQQDEYNHFASFGNGKNVLKIYYVTNANTSPVKRLRMTLNDDYTVTTETNTTYSVLDVGDTDGDEETYCRIPVAGYVVGVQTYDGNSALVPDKYYTKMVYEGNGIYAGQTLVYMEKDEYDFFSSLEEGKNVIDAYFISSVFPASVTITETQLRFPSNSAEYVALDASGNRINISDSENKDGEEETHVLITVSGFALDMDGYYDSEDTIKKRFVVKMSYNSGIDTTDIYLEKETYEHVCSMPNGKNIVSIYCVGAGIGTDSSRIQTADSSLDSTSERAIQNKAVAEVISSLTTEINALKARIETLEG